MPTHRWFNPSQPQTLQTAVILLYFNAAWALLTGLLVAGIAGGIGLITVLGVAGGYGIANERKWGYWTALGVAIFPFLLYTMGIASVGFHISVTTDFIIDVLFKLALVVLLVHPLSRDYRRIWFK